MTDKKDEALRTERALKLALEALEGHTSILGLKDREIDSKAITAIRDALAEQEQRWAEFNETTKKNIEHAEWYLSTHPAQQPHCNDCEGFDPECPLAQPTQQQEPVAYAEQSVLDWLASDRLGPTAYAKTTLAKRKDGKAQAPLYTSPPASKPHDCARSHPHENMDAMCELRTEIARLTNENAKLKAQQQEPVAWLIDNDYTTVFCGIAEAHRNKGAKVEHLYTSPQPSKPLTDEQIIEMYNEPRSDAEMLEFARAIEAAHGIKGDA